MGLTGISVGLGATEEGLTIIRHSPEDRVVALAGNPNVGKSTLFNVLTGLHQHTGNWPGKTVVCAQGRAVHAGRSYTLVDLPGTYSLSAHSAEEEAARDFLRSGQADCVVVVCDAACLERNLILALQVQEITERMILCVNLMDEAEKRGIHVDLAELSRRLHVPVVGTCAGKGTGIGMLMNQVEQMVCEKHARERRQTQEEDVAVFVHRAEKLAAAAVRKGNAERSGRDIRWDRFLVGRFTGIPMMVLLLAGILWLTVVGANGPSRLLAEVFLWGQEHLSALCMSLNVPAWLHGALVLGIYRVLTWVISVMLPPMAIFFPLFTLLEDLGYLPRVAFVLDRAFQKAGACGKQALTLCMGFGCNAAGVVGCRIIDSPRERMIAVITNSLVPCNGRFPTLLALITLFFAGAGGSWGVAALLTGVILLAIGVTLLVSGLLSHTLLKGVPSSFALELPPYRKPQVGQVIVRSVFDRTLFVLARAVAAAAPAGLIIWLCANITVGGQSVLSVCTGFLDPFARLFGLDGVILMAFVLGLPANEIVLPVMLMGYLAGGTLVEAGSLGSLGEILTEHGWTWVTAACTMLFSLFHWPCATTCMTIARESGSLKWTVLSVTLPAAVGFSLCFCVAQLARILCLG